MSSRPDGFRRRAASAAFIALFLLAAGCTTSHTLSAWEAHDAMRLASHLLGGSHDVQLVMIPSRSESADAEFLEASRYYGRSSIAEQVAESFAASTNGPQELAVVGRNSEKTAQVIHDALVLCEGVDLSRLTVVYLGDLSFAPALEAQARARGVRLLSALYPPPP
jgi:hypothetical protein